MTAPLRRIVVTGSECTGKSTLGAWLATHYRVPLVSEYARVYAERTGTPIDTRDHWPIVRGQVAAEERAVAHYGAAQFAEAQYAAAQYAVPAGTGSLPPRPPLLLLDTDLLSTVVYAHHYTGWCAPEIEALARARVADHYLLLDIDVPWVADGVRDRGDRREELHALFTRALERFGAPYTLVSGSWHERQRAAVRIIDALLSGGS